MAATEVALSETLKNAKGEIDNTILDILAQRLYEGRGILSPVLHPVGFFEADKPLWERINSPSRDTVFSAWLQENITLEDLNTALFEKCRGRLPKDITYADYVAFMKQQNKDEIFRFLFEKDPFRRSAIEYVFQKSLLDSATREKRKAEANTKIEFFYATSKISTQTFEKNKEDIANLDLSITNFCRIHKLPRSYLMCYPHWLENKEDFKRVAEQMTDLEKQLAEITPALNPTGKLIDETQWDVNTVLNWVKQRIALSEEIQSYSEVISTIDELELTKAYEQEITTLASKFEMPVVKAAQIIALIVQGKTEPYLPILTDQEYQKRLSNIEKLKSDLYYRTARKEIDGLLLDSSGSTLEQLATRMKKIVSIIELASYDVGLGGEIIHYEVEGLKVDLIEKENRIPKTLFLYRKALLDLIAESENPDDVETYRQHFNKEMAHLVDSLMKKKQMNQDRVTQDNSIHYRMHIEFLTSLRAIIEPVSAPEGKSEAIEIVAANSDLTPIAHSNPSGSLLSHRFTCKANIMGTTAPSDHITNDAITRVLKGKASNPVNARYQKDLEERAARRIEKEESRSTLIRLHVRREMPEDFSNIKDGYLFIFPHDFYHVDSEYLYPCTIKDTVTFSKTLGAFCKSHLENIEKNYGFSLLIDTLDEWKAQKLQPSDKRILLFADEEHNLHCKMCLPNGNTITITLENTPYNIKDLHLIKKAILAQIKDKRLLFPIDLTFNEVSSLISANTAGDSYEQRIKISTLAKPNPSSFQAENARRGPQLSASLPTFSTAFSIYKC